MNRVFTAFALASLVVVVACGDDDTKTSSSGGGSSSSGGASSSGGGKPVVSAGDTSSLTGSCATLRDCCPKITEQSAQNGCNTTLSLCGNNQKVCDDALNDYKSKCP